MGMKPAEMRAGARASGKEHGLTLLEKAKSTGRKIAHLPDDQRDELIDLAIAYYNGEVSGSQVAAALDLNVNQQSHAQGRLSTAMRSAIKAGIVTPPRRRPQ